MTIPPGAAPCRELLRPEVLAAFDRDRFERDGYWVWDGVLTDEGRRRWTANLQRLQTMNDAVLTGTDWGAVDYEARGLPAPRSGDLYPRVPGLLPRRLRADAGHPARPPACATT